MQRIYLVEMTHRAFVLLQVAIGSEGNPARVASMRPFQKMNIHVNVKQRLFRELFVTHGTATFLVV